MTISNLRGVPYRITFRDGGTIGGHGMLNHGDRAHFIINGLGGQSRTSAWAGSDSGTAISVDTLPEPGAPMPPQWRDYLQAALASSAFPVGLAPRLINSTTADYAGRMWPFPHDNTHAIDPYWPTAWEHPRESPTSTSMAG